MKTLLTIGTFDIPHAGHAAFLNKCAEFGLCDVLVGVNSDDFVERYKGKRPTYNQTERMRLIESLGFRAYLNPSAGHELIRALQPDIIAIGTDWMRKDYYAQIETPPHYFEDHGIAMLYVPYTAGISTSDIKNRLDANIS